MKARQDGLDSACTICRDFQEPNAVILRHASTSLNERGEWQGRDTNAPLSASGRHDAAEVGLEICRIYPEVEWTILTSPLLRAQQTALAFSKAGVKCQELLVCDELIEADVGRMTGRTWGEFARMAPSEFAAWKRGLTPSFREGENRDQLLERARDALAKARGFDRVIVVTHLMLMTAVREMLPLSRDTPISNLGGFMGWYASSDRPRETWCAVGDDHCDPRG
ncbi:histidine phosphatase family protein [Terrabacter sp. Root181]|uniref:histidine phosphatase family protein n=1 Tax=Terrabacter sp. Root181 TaxID=1736484 RepID=UPI0009E9F151